MYMKDMNRRIVKIRSNPAYKYILFTVCFWIGILPLIIKISKSGLAAFGGWDAITETYPVMLYTSRYIREFFSQLFAGEFAFPTWTWSLGMGDDIISAINWHGFGDPFYLVTAFVPETTMPYFYTFFFYFRVFLGGMTFIAYAAYMDVEHKKSNFAYVIGAMVYSFTGFTVQCNYHILFVHTMMYLPLLFLAVERTMDRKRKWLMTITVFGFAMSGFFFLYIGSIALAIYVIYRLLRKKYTWKDAFKTIGELIAEYLVGLGAAGIMFLPGVVGFLTSNRAIVRNQMSLFFNWEQIKQFALNLFFPNMDGSQVLSIATIGVVCLVAVLFAKEKKIEKINIVVLLFITWIPPVSCLMSGFGEIYDRWEVVITVYFAYLTFLMWDELKNLTWVQKIAIFIPYCLTVVYGKKEDILDLEHPKFRVLLLAYTLTLGTIYILLPLCKKVKLVYIGELLFFCCTVLMIQYAWRDVERNREISYVTEPNYVQNLIEEDSVEFYRVDNSRTFLELRNAQNIALMMGYNSISEYMSIENSHFTNGYVNWNVSPHCPSQQMNIGMDYRTVLETLSSVKYFLLNTATEQPTLTPYGFQKVNATEDNAWTLFENENFLPMIYAYDQVFAQDLYETYSGFERQEVMVAAAGIQNYNGNIPVVTEVPQRLYESSYEIIDIENGSYDGEKITCEGSSAITVRAMLKGGAENYLLFDHPGFGNNAITIKVGEVYEVPVQVVEGYYNGYLGINLGYYEKDEEVELQIILGAPEQFAKSSLQLLHYDFSDYESDIDKLRIAKMSEVITDTNRISCSLELDKGKFVCIATPYSSGWKAYVDGVETTIYVTNDMFMGIDVPEGAHEIVLKYTSPGIKTGIITTILAILVAIFYEVIYTKRKQKENAEETFINHSGV